MAKQKYKHHMRHEFACLVRYACWVVNVVLEEILLSSELSS